MAYNLKLLRAIRKSGWSIEEISGLLRIPESIVYKILSGDECPGDVARQRFATILDCKIGDLFEEQEV